MQSSRMTLVEILRDEFTTDTVKNKCIESSLTKIEQGKVTRMFDDYPSLLTEDEVTNLTHDFQAIFEKIDEVDNTDQGFKLTNSKDKTALANWEKGISFKACQELLDTKGLVKTEIIALLGWEKHVDKIHNCDLVCAYIGAINHLTMQKLTSLIVENQTKSTAIFDYVNKNYRSWAKEVMQTLNLPIDTEHETYDSNTDMPYILDLPFKYPAIGIGLGVSSLLIASLAIGYIIIWLILQQVA